jgi:adenylate kinase family enzyme
VLVVGNSGSGKSTVAARLAALLDVPHIEMDALHHGPNWTEVPDELMRARVADAVRGDGWVADGNYSQVRDLIWPRAELLVWLDLPLHVILRRLTRRTFGRWRQREELWGMAGNRESIRTQLASRDSLFVGAVSSHRSRRRRYLEITAANEYPQLQIVRLTSSRDVDRWLETVAGDRTAESPSDGKSTPDG